MDDKLMTPRGDAPIMGKTETKEETITILTQKEGEEYGRTEVKQ